MQKSSLRSKLAHSSSAVRRLRAIRRETLILGLISIGLGVGQALLNYAQVAIDSSALILCQALLLYFSAILFPRRFGWTSVVAFVLASAAVHVFLVPLELFFVARLALFSAVIAFSSGFRLPPPPIAVVVILWGSLLAVLGITPLAADWGIPFSITDFAPIVAVEITASITLGLLRLAPAFNTLLTGTRQTYAIRVVLIEIMALTAFLCAGTLGYFILRSQGDSLDEILPRLTDFETEIWVTFAVLLGLPILLGIILTQAVERFFRYLRETAAPTNKLVSNTADPLPIAEFLETARQARAFAAKVDADTRERLRQIKNLKLDTEGLKEELTRTNSKLSGVYRLFDAFPWACVGLNSNGTILHYNQAFRDQLKITNEAIVGKHFSDLKAEHSWYRELTALVSLTCKNLSQLGRTRKMKHYSSSVDGSYLEIELSFFDLSNRPEVAVDRAHQALSNECSFVLSFRQIPDLREYQLRLIVPNSIELLGGQALELCRRVHGELESIVKHIETVTSPLSGESDVSIDSQERTLEATLLLKNIERNLKKSSENLKSLTEEVPSTHTNLERTNLTRLIQDCLDHLIDLLGTEEQIPVKNINEGTRSGRGTPQDADIIVVADLHELTRFSAYLLNLVRTLLQRDNRMNVEIGYENISQTAASLISGARPGRFCRIVLSQSGQTASMNIIGGKVQSPAHYPQGDTSPEAACAFLSYQTKRLGGFLSVQSSAGKGTHITIYVPVDPGHAGAVQERPQPVQKVIVDTRPEATQRALVVGQDDATVAALESMLRDLGYQAKIQNPKEARSGAELDYGFGGAGFSSGESNAKKTSKKDDLSQGAGFDVLIVMIDEITKTSLELLRQLQNRHPAASTLVVTDPDYAQENALSAVNKLIRPFDLPTLRSALENANDPKDS